MEFGACSVTCFVFFIGKLTTRYSGISMCLATSCSFTFSLVKSDKSDSLHAGGVCDHLDVSSVTSPAALEVNSELVGHAADGQHVGHPGHNHGPAFIQRISLHSGCRHEITAYARFSSHYKPNTPVAILAVIRLYGFTFTLIAAVQWLHAAPPFVQCVSLFPHTSLTEACRETQNGKFMQLEMRLLSRANISAVPRRHRHKPHGNIFSKSCLLVGGGEEKKKKSYVNTCGANIY